MMKRWYKAFMVQHATRAFEVVSFSARLQISQYQAWEGNEWHYTIHIQADVWQGRRCSV
jgi:hypothetical protein